MQNKSALPQSPLKPRATVAAVAALDAVLPSPSPTAVSASSPPQAEATSDNTSAAPSKALFFLVIVLIIMIVTSCGSVRACPDPTGQGTGGPTDA